MGDGKHYRYVHTWVFSGDKSTAFSGSPTGSVKNEA